MKTVFTNGCFDILHPGHIHLLREAADLGDRLIVGINSDYSISKIKPGRPINDEDHRRDMLYAIPYVDLVITFNEPTPLRLIGDIKPDILVKGCEYDMDNIVGAEEVESWGGCVVPIEMLYDYSTTKIIDRCTKSK